MRALASCFCAVALLRSSEVLACAIAPAAAETVRLDAEDALIVWDPKSGTEHFIRRAQFETASKDFGFLVPTPTQPVLAEADDAVFSRLDEHTKPEVVTKRSYELAPGGFLLVRSKSEASAGVNVLDVARVAGLDAVVLEADSATALGEWLTKHGYAFRKELVGWVEPYVKKHWKITAFKIARDSATSGVGTRALRMSFQTKEPFFPYREPETMGTPPVGGPRILRVSFVSTERVEGQLEVGGKFPGKAVWAGALANASTLLAGAVPASDVPSAAYLTVIEDGSSPRPGFSDVYFRRDAEQAELRRPPEIVHDVVEIPVPLELVPLVGCFGLGIGAFLFLRHKRRKSSE
jgi:hypothetical protein